MSSSSSAMIFTPGEEVRTRIDRLRPLMEKGRLDAAFFHYKIDYYYLSGTMQDVFLLVPIERDPVLFVKRELKRARRESPLEKVIPLKTLDEIKPYVVGMRRVGLQLDVMPYNMVMKYRDLLPGPEFVDVSPMVKEVRKTKSPFEVTIMERAAAIAKKVYARIPEVLHEGMSEIELGGVLEAYAKPLGHEGILRMRSLNYEPYTWHILSGRTGSIVSQADSPMGGLGLSPAFPRRGEQEEDAQRRAHSDRFRRQLSRLPYGPHQDVCDRPHAGSIHSGIRGVQRDRICGARPGASGDGRLGALSLFRGARSRCGF